MAKEIKDYKTLAAELSAILEWYSSDDVDLEEAVSKYEQGLALVAALEECLNQAENKVTKIDLKYTKI